MNPVNTCKHGVDDGACKECYMESTNPVKEDEGKVCARCGAIAYDPVIPQTVKELTDEEIQELSEKHLDMDWQTGVIDFARAILKRAQEK